KEEQIVFSPLIPPLAALSLIVVGQWLFHSTASSYSTRMELLLLVSDVILLFLALQAFRTLQDWRGFIWFGMIFGFLVSLFGVLQHLTFNGKLYWFRDMEYGGIPFGPYVNRNHFAGFVEFILPLSLVDRNGTRNSADRLSAVRNPLRWENCQSHTQRLLRGPGRNRDSWWTLLCLVLGCFVQRIPE